ncbi:hypothetical protein G9A89_011945 [Geosiphon pyriformis]|nr:hypothetical protein G9A89_011945 [Geosiphon pyriformis]
MSNYVDIELILGFGEKTFFLAASAFVDDTIWVESSQASMQYILNIASEFFVINDISINNDKMGLSKPSLAQAHKDVKFFSNIVLRKAITDKQFCYLVSAVLQPIVSYRVQFSFVTLDVFCKWNIIIKKDLKAKAGLPRNFPSKILYHPSLYGLKPFEQVQFERKLALLILFSNGCGILRHLFNHRFLDLQVLGWSLLNLLQFSVKLHISSINNFLAEMVKIFLENKLSLLNNLPCAFHGSNNFPMFGILGQSLYYKSVFSLKHFGVAFGDRILNKKEKMMDWKTFWHWKQLNPRGSEDVLSVLDSDRFSESDCIKVYTDGSLRCAGSVGVVGGTAAYLLAANVGIGVKITGLLSSTLAKLQTVVLVLEYVPSSCSVVLYLNSQSAIDACISETSSTTPDFHNQCWIERLQIVNLLKNKNISIKWVKVKKHSDVLGNIKADILANEATFLFLVAEKTAISGNVCHFARDLYQSICCAHWEAGLGFGIVPNVMIKEIDWDATEMVWHLNLHLLSGFTSRKSTNLHMYLMKAIYRQLPVAVRKRLYNRSYPGVLCLLYGEVEFSDHVFTCSGDFGLCGDILMSMSSLTSLFPSAILLLLSLCSSDVSLYTTVYKSFVIKDWYAKAVSVFEKRKKATQTLVKFIRFVMKLQYTRIWTIRTKHRVKIEKTGLVEDNNVVSGLFSNVVFTLSAGVVCMLGVIESFTVKFGRHKLCRFFSDLSGNVFIVISV